MQYGTTHVSWQHQSRCSGRLSCEITTAIENSQYLGVAMLSRDRFL